MTLPRRPVSSLLDAQLCEALSRAYEGDQSYRSYLAATVKECLQGLIRGDASAPDRALQVLNLALHEVEHMPASFPGLEAATWVRAVAWFLEVAQETAQYSTLLRKDAHPVDRQALEILRLLNPTPVQRAKILEGWMGPKPSEAELGQALTRCFEVGAVCRLDQYGPGGAFYRITERGQGVLETLGL